MGQRIVAKFVLTSVLGKPSSEFQASVDTRRYRLSPSMGCVCCAELLNHVGLLATPRTVTHQAPLSTGILQARILEWVAVPLLQGIFPTQGWNPGLPQCRWILYHLSHKGSAHTCMCLSVCGRYWAFPMSVHLGKRHILGWDKPNVSHLGKRHIF